MDDKLAYAADLADDGDLDAARDVILSLIEEDKMNFEAWQALSQLAQTDHERRHAIYKMWGLRPNNLEVNLLLDQLKRGFMPPLDRTCNNFSSRNYYKKKPD